MICRDFPRIVNLRAILWAILHDIDEVSPMEGTPVDPIVIIILRCLIIPSSVLDRRLSCLNCRDLISPTWNYCYVLLSRY